MKRAVNILNKPKKVLTKFAGFTLTELVMVIVIMGIIGAVITPLIGNKFSAVAQSTERAEWVQQAEFALFHLRNDLAYAVPNSVYGSEPASGANQVVEFLGLSTDATHLAARYRDKNLTGFDRLQPNNDVSFDVFANIPNLASFADYVSIGTANATAAIDDWQNNLSLGTGSLAAIASATANPTGSENAGPLTTITLTGNHNFGGHSPYFRVYFFNGPTAYQCDTSAGLLYRVSNYTTLGTTNFSGRTATAVRSIVVDHVLDCEFEFIAGTTYSPPQLKVTLGIGAGTESIRLIDKIILENAS